MEILRHMYCRLRAFFQRESLERDMNREMRLHLELLTKEYEQAGLPTDDARRAARRRFGNLVQIQEGGRDIRGAGVIEELFKDLRYAVRTLLRAPVFTVVVVLSLALGIGANTALFSVIDAAVLRKLPVENPDDLVFFSWVSGPQGPFNRMSGFVSGRTFLGEIRDTQASTSFSHATFERFRASTRTLSDVFAFAPFDGGGANVTIDGRPERVEAQYVSGNYFSALGVKAALGRTMMPSDDTAFADPGAVISYKNWQRRFDSDMAIIGKRVVFNGLSLTIVGVAPAGFSGALGAGSSFEFLVPLAFEPEVRKFDTWLNHPDAGWLRVMGRKKPGVWDEEVKGELEGVFHAAVQEGWNALPPESRPPFTDNQPSRLPRLSVLPGSRGVSDLTWRITGLLWTLSATFAFLLLIVCINVANLQLARAAARQHEIGVRRAIGASRFRVVRQLLTESLLLAFAAGTIGGALAYWGKELFRVLTVLGPDLDLRVNPLFLGVTAMVSLLAGVAFGLLPAVQATRFDVASAVKRNVKNLNEPVSRLSKSLLLAQVAMSVVLLAGAGLLLRTIGVLPSAEVGFDTKNLLLFRVNPQSLQYENARMLVLYDQIVEKINAVPGVVTTTMSSFPLVSGSGTSGSIYLQGGNAQPSPVRWLSVRPNFFAARPWVWS